MWLHTFQKAIKDGSKIYSSNDLSLLGDLFFKGVLLPFSTPAFISNEIQSNHMEFFWWEILQGWT